MTSKMAAFLLAAVMSIGGILTFWFTGLTQQTLMEGENKTQELCSVALFGLYSGKYDKFSKSLYLVLQNKRSVDLQLENLYLFYPNNVMKTIPLNEILKGNAFKPLNITEIDDRFQKGLIKTNCPAVSVEFTYSKVAGIQIPL